MAPLGNVQSFLQAFFTYLLTNKIKIYSLSEYHSLFYFIIATINPQILF